MVGARQDLRNTKEIGSEKVGMHLHSVETSIQENHAVKESGELILRALKTKSMPICAYTRGIYTSTATMSTAEIPKPARARSL